MDALAQEVELLDAVHLYHHLAVEHEPRARQCEHLLHHLGEVAVHGPAVAGLQLHVVTVPEHDHSKAVPLGLEKPALTVRELLRRTGELRFEGRLEWKGHG